MNNHSQNTVDIKISPEIEAVIKELKLFVNGLQKRNLVNPPQKVMDLLKNESAVLIDQIVEYVNKENACKDNANFSYYELASLFNEFDFSFCISNQAIEEINNFVFERLNRNGLMYKI
jgi:hypothetical protein